MPRGPLGFPRLTLLGPLVSEGLKGEVFYDSRNKRIMEIGDIRSNGMGRFDREVKLVVIEHDGDSFVSSHSLRAFDRLVSHKTVFRVPDNFGVMRFNIGDRIVDEVEGERTEWIVKDIEDSTLILEEQISGFGGLGDNILRTHKFDAELYVTQGHWVIE